MGEKNYQQGSRRGPGVSSRQQAGGAREKIQFWADRGTKRLDPKLFSEKARTMAQELGQENKAQDKVNKRTQIRKFYDEVLRLNDLAQSGKAAWDVVIPQVHMLVAKTAYANGRQLVSPTFLNFIQESVAQVESQEDLRIFANFFEAFMGFYRLYGPKN